MGLVRNSNYLRSNRTYRNEKHFVWSRKFTGSSGTDSVRSATISKRNYGQTRASAIFGTEHTGAVPVSAPVAPNGLGHGMASPQRSFTNTTLLHICKDSALSSNFNKLLRNTHTHHTRAHLKIINNTFLVFILVFSLSLFVTFLSFSLSHVKHVLMSQICRINWLVRVKLFVVLFIVLGPYHTHLLSNCSDK